MKKVLFIFTFLLAFSYMNAQENKFAAKRAAKAVAFILSEMDFTDAQAQFIEETLKLKAKVFLIKRRKSFIGKQLLQLENCCVKNFQKEKS
jgi:K+/H+ antiporter YhaU regulatory subunit KhtT